MDKDAFSGLERGADACAGCGAALASAQPAYAGLFLEAEGLRRRDYCGPCFARLEPRPTSFWKRAPAAVKPAQEDDRDERRAARRRDLDSLLEAFERLADPACEKGPDAQKLRYLLALALVRKKRLQLVELAREGGADCLVIRASGDAELVTVPAPAMGTAELERLAADLENEVGLA